MPDVMTTVGSAIGLAKQLLSLSEVARSADAKLMVAELREQLADLKCSLADLIEENLSLKEQLRQQEELPSLVPNDEGLYVTAEGDGPFCPPCFDQSGKRIRLQKSPGHSTIFGKLKCGACGEFFV